MKSFVALLAFSSLLLLSSTITARKEPTENVKTIVKQLAKDILIDPTSIVPPYRGNQNGQAVDPTSFVPPYRGNQNGQAVDPTSFLPPYRSVDPTSFVPPYRGNQNGQAVDPTSFLPPYRSVDPTSFLPPYRGNFKANEEGVAKGASTDQ